MWFHFEDRRRPMSQFKQPGRQSSLVAFMSTLMSSVDWLRATVLSLLIHKLISSNNRLTGILGIMFDQMSGHPWPVKLTHKCNHHKREHFTSIYNFQDFWKTNLFVTKTCQLRKCALDKMAYLHQWIKWNGCLCTLGLSSSTPRHKDMTELGMSKSCPFILEALPHWWIKPLGNHFLLSQKPNLV